MLPIAWSRAPRVLAAAVSLSLWMVCSACARPGVFEGAQPTAQRLAAVVVSALNRGDLAGLEAVAVSETEFRAVVWPRLPAARPERNLPWHYVWNDLASKSRMQLQARADAWTAMAYDVVDIQFDGEPQDYGDYRIHRDARIQLRTPEGRVVSTRLFGSVIERHGQFKVFSYIVD